MRNPYKLIEAKVEKVIEESPAIKTLVLKPGEDFSFATGQFIELALYGIGEAPFTPSSSPHQKDKLDVTIMNAGHVTKKIHNLKAGDRVGIRGPYGKGYPLEKLYGREVVILGGGVGLAPLRSFLLALLAEADRFKKIILCYGAKTPEDIIYKDEIQEWKKNENLEVHLSVDKPDKNWKDTVGVVTVLLDKIKVDTKEAAAIVCGPPIMMKFGATELLDRHFPPQNIYLSMEKNMSCGIGKCGHCMMGKYFVCKDGPVFTLDQIEHIPGLWD